MTHPSYRSKGSVIASSGTLWELWIPGQCPPGKNQVQLRRDPETGRLRPRPRRRKNTEGDWVPTTWERWFWKLDDHMYWRRLEHRIAPISSITRLIVHYWWGDLRNRDEPGRMDALSALLEATEWVTDDKYLRQSWRYHGLDRKEPGLYLSCAEEDATYPYSQFNDPRAVGPSNILGLDAAKVTVRSLPSTEFGAVDASGKKDL